MRSFFSTCISLALLAGMIAAKGFAQSEYLVTVDPVTGALNRIDSIPGLKQVKLDYGSTVDHQNNRYFFVGQNAGGVNRLYTINATTGAVINNPVFNTSPFSFVFGIEYDPALGMLLALASVQYSYSLVKINPVTGNIAVIAAIPGLQSITYGSFTYDRVGKRYFFRGSGTPGDRVYTLDAQTGSILSQLVIPSVSLSPMGARYNNANGTYYTCASLGLGAGMNLIKLDPATLSSTLISFYFQNGIPTYPNYVSLDETTNRYTYISANVGGALVTVDLSSGSVLSSPSFPALPVGENIVELRYSTFNGKLYGIHRGFPASTVTSLDPLQAEEPVLNMFPNPFSNSTTLLLNKTEREVVLRLTDAAGRTIREERFSNVTELEIKRGDLAPGLYFAHISSSGGTVMKKLAVE